MPSHFHKLLQRRVFKENARTNQRSSACGFFIHPHRHPPRSSHAHAFHRQDGRHLQRGTLLLTETILGLFSHSELRTRQALLLLARRSSSDQTDVGSASKSQTSNQQYLVKNLPFGNPTSRSSKPSEFSCLFTTLSPFISFPTLSHVTCHWHARLLRFEALAAFRFQVRHQLLAIFFPTFLAWPPGQTRVPRGETSRDVARGYDQLATQMLLNSTPRVLERLLFEEADMSIFIPYAIDASSSVSMLVRVWGQQVTHPNPACSSFSAM